MRPDTLFHAETPEGIVLSLRPAGVVARSQAYLIDLGIRIGLFMAVMIVGSFTGKLGAALMFVTYFLLEWLYPVLFELTRSAATPGKRMLGLRVVMDSGLPVTPAASFTRNLLRTADFMPALYGIGLVCMLWRQDNKRLGDLAAGTLVVFSQEVVLHGAMPDAEARPPARPLSPREQRAIVAWAGRFKRLTPERLQELALLAAPALPPARQDRAADSATQRLLGVAQWVLGRRAAAQEEKTP